MTPFAPNATAGTMCESFPVHMEKLTPHTLRMEVIFVISDAASFTPMILPILDRRLYTATGMSCPVRPGTF
jgi:hypothetical protein